MRTHGIFLLLLATLVGFAAWAQEDPKTNSTVPITIIRYCLQPFSTFEIVGTDVKGVEKLTGLTEALRKHKQQHPQTRYEVLAEVKSTPEGERAIVAAVVDAGISLEHYWAAHSAPAPGAPAGPHGIGYVDHIDRYKKSR